MKKLLFSITALLCASIASSQPSGEFTGALLWKISGGGLGSPSYILGTHHLNGQETFDAITGARTALEASEQVVGEMVMTDQPAMATQLQLAALMPEDVSYRSLLSSTDYETLDNGLKGLIGVGMDQMGMFKPGLVSLTMSQVIFMQAYPEFNAAAHVAMDVIVQNHATETGKAIIGLETIEDQIYVLLDAEPMKIQAEALICDIDNMDALVEQMKELTALYDAGDLAGMYELSFGEQNPCPSSEEAKFALLKGRNDKWLERLPEIMGAAPSFIAVGALHLAGEEGLLAGLNRLGYTVEAVK